MPIQLALASFYTLGILFSFSAAIIFMAMYFLNSINMGMVILLTIIFNFAVWMFGPFFTDWIHKIFYHINFFSREQFKAKHQILHDFIEKTTVTNHIDFPKIGIITDDNPTAYTYGSGAFNARIVFTTGLFTYLEPNEIEAVIAHEIGHIVHRDFIVMTVANTILQLLYEMSEILMKIKTRTNNDKNKKTEALFFVGLLSYVFYTIGFYVVLFLSRVRESYADEFSAQTTKNPHALSNALIKIAYGIVAKADDTQSLRLIKSTRALSIMGFRTAKGTGLVAQATQMDPAKIAKVMLYDLVSPWAKLAELNSTHPLTGKRLARLDKLARNLGQKPLFDMPTVYAQNPVDVKKLWAGFWSGVFINYLPLIAFLSTIISIPLAILFSANNLITIIPLGLGITGLSVIARAWYKYPPISNARNEDVVSLMSDLYTTPVRGKAVALQGTVIGRGLAGYVFSEDMMFQDNTGLMYLDYQAGIPLIGNLVFAWKKVKQLLGQPTSAKGWFFRSNQQYIALSSLQYSQSFIRSYAKFWQMAMGISLLLTSLLLILVLI